jgi:hypothetical protein
MSQYTVTVIDTVGIQPYIFSSNRLRENVGASYLVECLGKEWLEEALKESIGERYHFPKIETDFNLASRLDQESVLQAEVIYTAGGNSVILFRNKDDAISALKYLSLKLLKEAPGLTIVAAHQTFDWEQIGSLKVTLDDLIQNQIEQHKNARQHSVPLLGMGVTASCMSTQLPAIGMSDPNDEERSYLISREVVYKIQASKQANTGLKKLLSVPEQFDFPLRFDHLGRTHNESSYVAVVHADGNNMGKRFKECGKDLDNSAYVKAIRQLSWRVQQAGIKALQAVAEKLIHAIKGQTLYLEGKPVQEISLELSNEDKIYLPFRPLVYGGDDVTFVCDGRLGLALAALYLEKFEQHTASDDEQLYACAGVSIAKAHYPFARSYNLSNELCKSAKQLVRSKEQTASAIDWHIAASGLLGSLKEIRQREYHVPKGRLHLRPLWLSTEHDDLQNWESFCNVVMAFNDPKKWSRNKVMALREELRQGPKETENFLQLYQLGELPQLSANNTRLSKQGWTIDVCGYFDAIEAMEFYAPLVEVDA